MASKARNELLSTSRALAHPVPDFPSWARSLKEERSINDRIEDYLVKIMNDSKLGPQFREWLHATTDAEAKEGSLSIDNAKAAEIIRDMARAEGDSHIGEMKLKAIVIHLNVVLNRYDMGRKHRRQTVRGKVVPPTSDNGNGDD